MVNQKSDIVTVEDKVVVASGLVNLSYKLFVGKYVTEIGLPNIPGVDEFNLVVNENVIDVPPMFGFTRSHLLKVLIKEANVL